MNRTTKILLICLVLDILLDLGFGITFGLQQHIGVFKGLYFTTTTATTVGYGDIYPRDSIGQWLALIIMWVVIPLFSATFSVLSAVLTTAHVDRRHDELKQHITEAGNGRPEGSTAGTGEPGPGQHLPPATGGGEPEGPDQPA